jgi:hypothetical protein
MSPIAASTGNGGMDQKQFLSELSNIQKSLFDHATNYTKLVLGIGYAGFFGAWAGTKGNLRPVELVGSALLICLSLFSYIVFEIFQTRFISQSAIDLARTLSKPGLEMSALQDYKERTGKVQERYFKWWNWIFHFCAGTGILGALILIYAFIHSLVKMIWR